MKRFMVLVGLLTLTFAAFAQDAPEVQDPKAGFWTTGLADISLGYFSAEAFAAWNQEYLPGSLTTLYSQVGAGYSSLFWPRDLATGEPGKPVTFDSPYARLALIAVQGLVAKSPTENLVEGFAGIRGRWEHNYSAPLSEVVFADANGIVGASLLAGVRFRGIEADTHAVLSGVNAELSAETGNPSFWRTTAKVSGFAPLFDLDPAAKLNVLSGYVGARVMAELAGGADIPLYVDNSFGGWDFGGNARQEIRGFPDVNLDTKFKAVANVDVRVLGPALFGLASLYPVAYAFADGASFAGFDKAPAAKNVSGTLATAGVGAGMKMFGPAVGVYLWYPVVEPANAPGYVSAGPGWGIFSGLKF
jgi:hypothetical protein